jgi:hypothetical protein
MRWHNGKLSKATLLSSAGAPCRLRTAQKVAVLLDGQPVETRQEDNGKILEFSTLAGRTYIVQAKR